MSEAASPGRPDRKSDGTSCLECHSRDVRPSGSSYPMDKERIGDRNTSFWRCGHCGARFLGPKAPEKKRRHHRSHHVHDPLAESLGVSRMVKRWVFPLIVLVVTALAVAFILDQRNRPAPPPIISPGR